MSDITAIQTHNLTRRFGKYTAVDQLNLVIPSKTIFGFIGPNGAGKTTTLRMLAGLLEPSSGMITLQNQRVDGTPKIRDFIGFMPDFFGVYEDLRVWEYLDFYARCHGVDPAKRKVTVDSLLDLVDLTSKRTAFVQHLSRGMQQRLCLAHALVHDPPILLLDEPASGLDPQARIELMELLRTLSDMGKTIVISSHILNELEDVCTSIGIMASGKLMASGPIDELRHSTSQNLRVVVLEDAPRAAHILGSLPGIKSVQPPESNVILADFNGDDHRAAYVLAALITAGLTVVDFHRESDNLELIFLRLVNGEQLEEVGA